ncbi:MAG: hypothetical protein ACFFB3_10015 [Candidatus Hodarchaeota archaeon]
MSGRFIVSLREDCRRTDGAIKILKRKEFLVRAQMESENGSKSLPELLVLSVKGKIYLRECQRQIAVGFEEWQAVAPRMAQLLKAPQIRFFKQHKGSFVHVREIFRLIGPLLPYLPLIDNATMAQIAAFR